MSSDREKWHTNYASAVPFVFLLCPNLFKPRHLRVYIALRSFHNSRNNTCYPRPKELAERAGLHINYTYRTVKELVQYGIIKSSKESTYFKYPNYRFCVVDDAKTLWESKVAALKLINNIPYGEFNQFKEIYNQMVSNNKSNGYTLLTKWLATQNPDSLSDKEEEATFDSDLKRNIIINEELQQQQDRNVVVVNSFLPDREEIPYQDSIKKKFAQQMLDRFGVNRSKEIINKYRLQRILDWIFEIELDIAFENGRIREPARYITVALARGDLAPNRYNNKAWCSEDVERLLSPEGKKILLRLLYEKYEYGSYDHNFLVQLRGWQELGWAQAEKSGLTELLTSKELDRWLYRGFLDKMVKESRMISSITT